MKISRAASSGVAGLVAGVLQASGRDTFSIWFIFLQLTDATRLSLVI